MMHAGNPERSKRLSITLHYLQGWASAGCTTAQLQMHTGSMAPATDVSELRASGYLIECRCEGTNKNGRRVYRYRYLGRKFA